MERLYRTFFAVQADFATALAPIAPIQFLHDLLASLASASPPNRTMALSSIAAEIARRGDDNMVWFSWRQVLTMAEADIRSYFMEQLRASLPLAARILGNDMVATVAEVVQRMTACFP